MYEITFMPERDFSAGQATVEAEFEILRKSLVNACKFFLPLHLNILQFKSPPWRYYNNKSD